MTINGGKQDKVMKGCALATIISFILWALIIALAVNCNS